MLVFSTVLTSQNLELKSIFYLKKYCTVLLLFQTMCEIEDEFERRMGRFKVKMDGKYISHIF